MGIPRWAGEAFTLAPRQGRRPLATTPAGQAGPPGHASRNDNARMSGRTSKRPEGVGPIGWDDGPGSAGRISQSAAPQSGPPGGPGLQAAGEWGRVFDEGLVRIDSEATAAAEAGYTGERNVSTWREHLRVLTDLGFIDTKPGPAGPCQYVLLFNPYLAAKRLHDARKIQELTFTTLLQRMGEIGATDLE